VLWKDLDPDRYQNKKRFRVRIGVKTLRIRNTTYNNKSSEYRKIFGKRYGYLALIPNFALTAEQWASAQVSLICVAGSTRSSSTSAFILIFFINTKYQ
jgi:hypothetical protein